MGKLTVLDHPVIQHKLTQMRDKNTGTQQFHQLVREVAMLMAYEVTRNLPLEDAPIETPVSPTIGKVLSGKKLAVVPILRAGLGLVDGFMAIMPTARIGHVGLYRNEETLEPVEYFCKLPSDLQQRSVVVLDPMLATGGSASAALTLLKQKGAKKLSLAVLVSAPEGIARIQKDHPDVDVITCSVDQGLNERGYIVPGLGDAGDRLFGTK